MPTNLYYHLYCSLRELDLYKMQTKNTYPLLINAQNSIEKLAYSDHLTGIRNFPKFLLDAQHLLQEFPNKKYAFWSFDIKGFHAVNAVFGGDTGDMVLRRIAALFEDSEENDHVFCRNLGDQFLGIRSYVKKKDLVDWFWSLVTRLDDRKILSKKQMPGDYIMGFYCLEDFEELPAIRDMANYATLAKKVAKTQTGNQFCFFSPELKQKIIREAALMSSKEFSLSHSEVSFVVQPKVSIEAEFRIVGGEVLTRWNHPSYGWVSPSEFIPLFEKNGFIVKLDRYIFQQTCAWYSQCLRQGIALPHLSINISRQSFMQEDVLDYYSSVKQAYNIADGTLELEITENIQLENYDSFRDTILAMQSRGFTCSIDDLGSGYSSLKALKNLPINTLKLDAVFFQEGPDTERGKIIAKNLINMAQELDIEAVAEGVEHPDQITFLKKIGCNIIQGYIFSKPLLQKKFIALLTKDKGRVKLQ